mmetsp:Transcript_98476/g.301268  ORF Transcript_98476/g.301268 Transcript_98476/m.301268 type:complete len:309 (+) Transcript_98476:2049-2975(+)
MLKRHARGKLRRKSCRASAARWIRSPCMEPLRSRRKMNSTGGFCSEDGGAGKRRCTSRAAGWSTARAAAQSYLWAQGSTQQRGANGVTRATSSTTSRTGIVDSSSPTVAVAESSASAFKQALVRTATPACVGEAMPRMAQGISNSTARLNAEAPGPRAASANEACSSAHASWNNGSNGYLGPTTTGKPKRKPAPCVCNSNTKSNVTLASACAGNLPSEILNTSPAGFSKRHAVCSDATATRYASLAACLASTRPSTTEPANSARRPHTVKDGSTGKEYVTSRTWSVGFTKVWSTCPWATTSVTLSSTP